MKYSFNPHLFFKDLPATTSQNFETKALTLFRFQYANNPVYREYAQKTWKGPESIKKTQDIPFLPVTFFKTQSIFCGDTYPKKYFLSSGTTGVIPSRSYVYNQQQYLENCKRCFNYSLGALNNYGILALIPLQRNHEHSSLICMIEYFIRQSAHPVSGFYYKKKETLSEVLQNQSKNLSSHKKTILFGLSDALYDFFRLHPLLFPELILIETGGMKGKKNEMTRIELHRFFKKQTGVSTVYSEYGMTELMSQSYIALEHRMGGPLNPGNTSSSARHQYPNKASDINPQEENGMNNPFLAPPWMKILIRDINDPFQYLPAGKRGAINIIDLANIHTCAFLELEDIGVVYQNGSFRVLGRMDTSEMRGCNLMLFS